MSRFYDSMAERLVGRFAKHSRYNSQVNVLQSAKACAMICADELYTEGSEQFNSLIEAIQRICPEQKVMEENKERLQKAGVVKVFS